MFGLLIRWIANYHEHESLLQENEDERLSKEEQDLAWEVYRRTLEWEEVQRFPRDEEQKPTSQAAVPPPLREQKPSVLNVPRRCSQMKGSLRNRCVQQRKCTNISHLLTLRSQGTKIGCTTVCGECAKEISWEDLNKDAASKS